MDHTCRSHDLEGLYRCHICDERKFFQTISDGLCGRTSAKMLSQNAKKYGV